MIRFILLGLAVWLVVSVPFALFMGQFIKAGQRD